MISEHGSDELLRTRPLLVVAALAAMAAACVGRDTAAQTTVTSASQGAVMTGTGATGGSTPETDMQGTGRASAAVVIPREVAPPPAMVPLPADEDSGVHVGSQMDAGTPLMAMPDASSAADGGRP